MASRRRPFDLDPVLDLEPVSPELVEIRPLRAEVADLVQRFARAGDIVVRKGKLNGRRLLEQMRKAVSDIEANRLAMPRITPEKLVRVVLDAARDDSEVYVGLDAHEERTRAALKRAGILGRVGRHDIVELRRAVSYISKGGSDKKAWLKHVANVEGLVKLETLIRDFNRWVKAGKVKWP